MQRQSKRVKFVREIVAEIAGLAPYERRVTELLKVGRDKRALKLLKKRVSHSLLRRKQKALPHAQFCRRVNSTEARQNWQCVVNSLAS